MVKKFLVVLLFPLTITAQNLDALKKATVFFSQSKNDAAIYYFEKGFTACTNCNTIEIANYYLHFGEAYKINENEDKALLQILKAEKIFKELKNHEGLVETKIALAELYRFNNKYVKGKEYIHEAKKIIDKHVISKKTIGRYYSRKIALEEKTAKTAPKILEWCKKGLQLAKEIEDYKLQFSILNEMAFTYDFSKEKNAKKYAKKRYTEALVIARKYHLEYETCDVLFTLGISTVNAAKILKNAGKTKEAFQKFEEYENYHKEALELASKLKYTVKQRDISYFMYISYREFKRYKKAMEYCKIAYKYEIERLKKAKDKEVAEIEGKYQTEKKDAEIKQNKSEIKFQYVGLAFLGISILSLFYFLKKSKYQKEKIEEVLFQKTMLLKEIHHRVKNNLQVISSLLYLQADKHQQPEIYKMVKDSQKHIDSIALIHEMLYQDDDLSIIGMKKYLDTLCDKMMQISSKQDVIYSVTTNNIALSIDHATPLGLIVNELFSNSIKYAFKNIKKPEIHLTLENQANNSYKFTYKDNGIGLALDVSKVTVNSLGIKLVKMFAEEMDANLSIESNNGLSYTLIFKTKQLLNG